MKKLGIFSFVLTMAIALAFSASALAAPAKDNPNQDFTGTPIAVAAPESVLVDGTAQVALNIKNIKDRGMPEVSIWVNDVKVQSYSEIGKGKTVEYVFDVDTAVVGTQTFDIVVWTRLGNKNFQDQLYVGTTTINVVAPEPETKTVDEWIADLNGAIEAALVDGALEVISGYGGKNQTAIVLTIDGVDYTFVGGNGIRSDKYCEIDGVIYVLNTNGNNPIRYSIGV